MTLDDFNSMDEHHKTEAVWRGTFLADREENGLTLQLYSVDFFYVEAVYDDRAGKILRFCAFSHTRQLVPYLAHIKFKLRH
jgi:hypothetical protein